ncbi:MAG: hypothetical protein COA35_017310, partial [Colwellia sp.]|nr:hypothetical protein [Colwellia sp.]
MKLNAKMVFVAYLLLIFGYGATYYFIAADFNVKHLSVIQSLYFSVVTITTLGFGDIAPVTDRSQIIVASEAIIGLFLNALWQYFASTIERQQSDAIARNLQLKNTREIILFYEYFETEIVEFRRAIGELTQTSSSLENQDNVELSFEFSCLSGLYQSSRNTMSGINKPIIHLYYQKLDQLL